MNLNRTARLALLLSLFVFALACRTTELIAKSRPTVTRARPAATKTQPRATRTQVVVQAEVEQPTQAAQAAEPTAGQKPPQQPRATNAPKPTSRPAAPPATQRPPNTAVPPAPTSQFPYQVTESRCGPNVRTYIEGYVFENNSPKNDVLVRISQGPDGAPDPNDDFHTGSDPRKGYFFQNIDANAPHEGTWYLWVIDPTSQQRISAIAIVKTDAQRVEDSGNSAGSCQSATLKFSNTAPVQRTAVPTRTTNPNGPTPEPTQDTGDDS